MLSSQSGSLEDQLERLRSPVAVPRSRPPSNGRSPDAPTAIAPPRDLEFFNGIGGFADDGREYAVQLDDAHTTPAPWINVVANPQFGFQVAAEGSGYTWACNSRENQLTAWSNDPVTDRPGEVLYVKDEESGELWAPTAAPFFAAGATHEVRHGQGYSRFRHESRGLDLELLMYVALADPIKISRLKIRNTETRSRVLSITAYAEWVLGSSRSGNAAFVETEIDASTQALFAQNPWNASFGSRVAFLDLAGRQTEWTADRREFLGRLGTLAEPAALLSAAPFSGRAGAGLDPCGALRSTVHLEPNETIEVVVFIGQAADASAARALLEHYRAVNLEAVFRSVVTHWDEVLGTVQVKTPDRSMDILLNRWALYQTLACRMWARAAFYQASGAYGFRDQLQDSMALTVSQPGVMREHLLRAAGRQFTAGDVQHWWLPESGRGVRTRISDDRPWLAYAAAHYVESTGDTAILDQKIPFIDGRELSAGEHDAFFEPAISDETASLFEHCARALDQSLAVGEHGLPLMGTGDWNDGMNRVGEQGRGESVWLGWFLHKTLTSFTALARARGEKTRCERWLAHANALQVALERNGWDGRWYRRGYFDDGTPLGSADSTECRIDSIAQSWSVLSGAAAPARAAQAMEEATSQLFQRDTGLALLFTPPFDRTPLDPGYIKGYPPGIRENGGQYTHAATWSVIAFAMLNRPEQAFELFSALNPINRTATRANVHRYKVEPYVVAADVYSVMPHTGRGGWTWYTGSAGWMYRAGLEGILGFRVLGDRLRLTPCIPARWSGFEIVFRYRTARYEIKVERPQGRSVAAASLELDGQPLPPGSSLIPLVDDGRIHQVRLVQV